MKIQYQRFQYSTDNEIWPPKLKVAVDSQETVMPAHGMECFESFGINLCGKADKPDLIFNLDNLSTGRVSLALHNEHTDKYDELDVTATVPDGIGALAALVHSVIAPAFVPGFAEVSWEDVRILLRSGRRARLMVATGSLEASLQEVSRLMTDVPRVAGQAQGIMLVAFASEDEHLPLGRYSKAMAKLRAELAPESLTMIAAPVLIERHRQMVSVLLTY